MKYSYHFCLSFVKITFPFFLKDKVKLIPCLKRDLSRSCFLFLNILFSTSFFVFSVPEFSNTHMLELLIWGPKALFIFLFNNFLLVLQTRWFLLLYFQVHRFIPHLCSAVKHIQQFLKIFRYCIFHCRISILFYFIVSVSLLKSPIF